MIWKILVITSSLGLQNKQSWENIRVVRVISDLRADFHGASINNALLLRPGLTNLIVSVLLSFREKETAVTSYIQAMFHQLNVPVNQSWFLQFLWWKEIKYSRVIVDHGMTDHVFGGISLPSFSYYALKKTTADNVKKYEEFISSILR